MTLKNLSDSLDAFYRDDNNVKDVVSLETLLNNVSLYFFSEYDKVDEAEFSAVTYKSHLKPADRKLNLRIDLKKSVDNINKHILSACGYGSLNGKSDFFKFFFKDDGSIRNTNYVIDLDGGKFFYRMRGSESYHVYKKMELFQIPDNCLKLVGKYRFNQEGIPCLYLGESLYCAWEEVRRKDFEQVNFAAFISTKKLTVLNFTIKPTMSKKEDFELAYLSLLVSDKVTDDDKYKFQYDVSNLIMDILQVSVFKGGNVDGIKYMSSRRYDGLELSIADKKQMYGYVFPPKGKDKVGNIDKWMRNSFKMTLPRTSFMYDIHRVDLDRTKTAITQDYQNTIFYMIEEKLKNESFEYCDK